MVPIVWVFQLSVSPPQPNRNLGERHKLPHRGPGQSPSRKRVLVHLELERTHLMAKILYFSTNIYPYFYDWKPRQKFPGGPINFQEISRISRRVFKFQEISRISRSCRHPVQRCNLTDNSKYPSTLASPHETHQAFILKTSVSWQLTDPLIPALHWK